MLGEVEYEYYPDSGEVVLQMRNEEGLITFLQESRCSSSEDGCGTSLTEIRKREGLCEGLSQEFGNCKRSMEEECGAGVMRNYEESDCGPVLRNKREVQLKREKRQMCDGVRARRAAVCGGSGKRAVSEECRLVLRGLEECSLVLEKRAKKTCTGEQVFERAGICYRYFPGPQTWDISQSICTNWGDGGRLATIEGLLTDTQAGKDFFNSVINDSPSTAILEELYQGQEDMFGGVDWKQWSNYTSNWAWIGVKELRDDEGGLGWKWAGPNTDDTTWSPVKKMFGLYDWARNQPDDTGNCVAYFDGLNGGEKEGAWWNVRCRYQLPFLCEKPAS